MVITVTLDPNNLIFNLMVPIRKIMFFAFLQDKRERGKEIEREKVRKEGREMKGNLRIYLSGIVTE